jgi:hypothetical protein
MRPRMRSVTWQSKPEQASGGRICLSLWAAQWSWVRYLCTLGGLRLGHLYPKRGTVQGGGTLKQRSAFDFASVCLIMHANSNDIRGLGLVDFGELHLTLAIECRLHIAYVTAR